MSHTDKRQKLDEWDPIRRGARDVPAELDVQLMEVSVDTDPKRKDTVLRVFGVDANGRSVLVNVHQFRAYLYVDYLRDLEGLKFALNSALRGPCVEECAYVTAKSAYGYSPDDRQFVKISFRSPMDLSRARKFLEDGSLGRKHMLYESRLPLLLRFLVDKGIKRWFRVKGFRVSGSPQSTCQIEVDCLPRNVAALDSDAIAPLRMLSFDIECKGRPGVFPTPDVDPIIQISAVVATLDGDKRKFVFTLGGCDPIEGVTVITSETEVELLTNFFKFYIACDPDVVTGYNIVNFDIVYVVRRCEQLRIVPQFGRLKRASVIRERPAWAKEELGFEDADAEPQDDWFFNGFRHAEKQSKNKVFQSDPEEEKARGMHRDKARRDDVETTVDGRIVMDCYVLIQREFKLRSYTLNAVSEHFLKSKKEDVHHSQISVLQDGTDADRSRLARYCVKDADLCLMLNHKLKLLLNLLGMALVTGVTVCFLLTRGQSIKAVSQIYSICLFYGYVVPSMPREPSGEKFEGATVIEPEKGYYSKTQPVVTLDFNSLYPSIIIAYNMCYTTLLLNDEHLEMSPDDYIVTPIGARFVKPSVRQGLLPEILKKLLSERSATKKLMEAEKDAFVQDVLNGKQLALKISANSIYGFTGAQKAEFPCLEISRSVTGYGREMIEAAKSYAESNFAGAKVVYGDTDSIMVLFGVPTLEEAFSLGERAAAGITDLFPKPIKIIAEKIMAPFLLIAKKRYASMCFTDPTKPGKLAMSGIETVRREGCKWVTQTMERCLHQLLIEGDTKAALRLVGEAVSQLYTNQVDMSLLVLSKGLSSMECKTPQAHVELAKRMIKRDPATAPRVGERIPFVVIQSYKNAKAHEKSENPMYALMNGLQIDANYYVNNQLRNPLTRILEPFCTASQLRDLFEGAHTRKVVKITPKIGGIIGWVKPLPSCSQCRVIIEEPGLCAACAPDTVKIHERGRQQLQQAKEAYETIKQRCYDCQGSNSEIICESSDCDVFYRRFKLKQDYDTMVKKMELF